MIGHFAKIELFVFFGAQPLASCEAVEEACSLAGRWRLQPGI
jgi:hypothetical protein